MSGNIKTIMMSDIKFWLKVLRFYIPDSIKKHFDKGDNLKAIQQQLEFAKRNKVSKEESKALIDSLPIGDCDIMLHTSMVRIGTLSGGKKWIADNLLSAINLDKNTLIVTASPTLERNSDYLKKQPVFDVRTAPIAMGAINEYIGALENAKRSVHPTHSVIAVGANADYYIEGQEKDGTPFGEHSPYYKIIKKRGKLLLFGATLDNVTMMHAIEDLLGDAFPFKVYDKRRFSIKCINSEGKEVLVTTPTHNAILGLKRSLMWMKEGLMTDKYMQEWKIGGGTVSLVDAYGYTVFYLNELLSGNSIYGRFNCSEQLKSKIKALLISL